MALVSEQTNPVEPKRALEAFWYTDPAIFEREREAVFGRTWQFACHASALKRAGDFVAFAIGKVPHLAVRDRQGAVRCYHNVCRHRAHGLAEGCGNRAFIVCPYHGWRYDLDGRLRSAPGEDRVPGFDRSTIALSEVRAEVFCGFVFVNLDAGAAPMAHWYPGVEQELRAFVPDIEALAPVSHVVVEEACNWKVSVENYSECYHCRLTHPTFSSGVIDPDSYDIRPQGHCLRHTTRSAGADSMTYAIDAQNAHAGEYSSWFLWPTFSFQVYPGNVLNTYLWRCSEHRSVTVTRGWYTPGGKPSEAIDRLAAQDRATTVAEDISIVESVQRGLDSGAYEPCPLVIDPAGGVLSEHSIAAIHGWLREALA